MNLMIRISGVRLLLLVLACGVLTSGCDRSKERVAPAPTPGAATPPGPVASDAPGTASDPPSHNDRQQGQSEVKAVPPDVLAPGWLEERRLAQQEHVARADVFHDFTFTDRLPQSGITFRNQVVADAAKDYKATHYDHGNGVAAADVDADGLPDLYFVSQLGGNQLWRNLGGGEFENITELAGVAVAGRIGVTASFADVDNDGDPDLYVTTVRGGNVLFQNDGTGTFRDVTADSGLGYSGHSSGAVFFDYDKDGLLDLFLCNVGVYTTDETGPGGYFIAHKDAFAGHLKPEERNEQSILFRNLGDCRFEDVSQRVELQDESWTGDAVPFDANQDGWIDLYVLNMQGHDEYYENVEGRRFVKRSREVFPLTPWGAMGGGVFDFDGDGLLDLFLTDMHSDMSQEVGLEREKEKSDMKWPESLLQTQGASIWGNAFFRNQGDGRFEEISDSIGAENYWPWGFSVGDLNADGWDDVFIASSMNFPFRYGVNSLLLNEGGRRFVDSEFVLGVEPRRGGRTAIPWFEVDCSGADRGHLDCEGRDGKVVVWAALGSRSSAILDLDDDGDLDIVTNDFNSEPMVLVSDLSERAGRLQFLKLELVGSASNRSGLGSVVKLKTDVRTITRVHDGKSGYLSQSLLPLYFGLGAAESIESIEVKWPSGATQVVPGPLEMNTKLTIREEPSAAS